MDLFLCLLNTVKSCFYLAKFIVVKVFIFLFYLSHIMCFESDELHFILNVCFPSFFSIISRILNIIHNYVCFLPDMLHKHDIKRCNCIFGNTQYTITEI